MTLADFSAMAGVYATYDTNTTINANAGVIGTDASTLAEEFSQFTAAHAAFGRCK